MKENENRCWFQLRAQCEAGKTGGNVMAIIIFLIFGIVVGGPVGIIIIGLSILLYIMNSRQQITALEKGHCIRMRQIAQYEKQMVQQIRKDKRWKR